MRNLPFILAGYNQKKAWYLNRRDQQFARRIEARAAEHLANLRTSNQACSYHEHDHRGSLALPSRGQPSDQSGPE